MSVFLGYYRMLILPYIGQGEIGGTNWGPQKEIVLLPYAHFQIFKYACAKEQSKPSFKKVV